MDTDNTFVWRHPEEKYLAIRHVATRVGWVWRYSWSPKIIEAWKGGLPSSPRFITDERQQSLSVYLDALVRIDITVETTTTIKLRKT